MAGVQGIAKQALSAPTFHINKMSPLNNDQNLTNFLVEAVDAEKQLFPLIHTKGLLHNDVMKLYHKARSSYEKIILNDHDLAELQDVEFSLWKLHYKHIDEYRNEIRQSSNREGQNLVLVQKHNKDVLLEGIKSFLSEATEFYQNLITKIRRSYGSSIEPLVFHEVGPSNSTESSEMLQCLFSCHRCLVCLGDLARYRELYGRPDTQNRNWSFAATHYLNASMIWPDSGNPQNQLAVLATYLGDEFLALYHCVRSLAVKEPFPDAWNNLILLFETNSSAHVQFYSHGVPFDFLKPSERSTLLAKAQSSEDVAANKDAHSPDQTAIWSLIVWMIGFFYRNPSLEDFPCAFGSTILQLEALLSLEDTRLKEALESYQSMNISRNGPFRALQLVTILIFTIHTLSESPTFESPKQVEHMQEPALIQQAVLASTFIIMGRFVGRCLMVNPVEDSPLLPAILIFAEWLVEMLDKVEAYDADEKCEHAMDYFFGAFANLLNQLGNNICDIKPSDCIAIWEDHELRGFLPVVQSHAPLDFSTQREPTNGRKHDLKVRVSRIRNAGMKIANRSNSSRKWILYDKIGRKFFAAEPKKLLGGRELTATASGPDLQASDSRLDVLPPIKESEQLVSEGDQTNLEIIKSSDHVEEEEVILFKPIKRYNSGQLPNQQICSDPSDLCSNPTGSRLKKLSWKEPLEEFSVTDLCTAHSEDAKTGGVPSLSGPPSLNGWVNIENLSITTEERKKEPARYGLESTEDFASTCLIGLTIGKPAFSQEDVKVNSSSPAPHFAYGLSPEKEYVTSAHGQHSSSIPDYLAPPYMPPLPSAPLLPDDATNWSSSDSSSYSESKDFEDVKEHFPFTSQVNSYSKFRGTQGSPNFDPRIPRFSYEYSSSPNRVDYFQRPQWYQENLNNDQVHDNAWPNQYHSPTYSGQFHDREHSRLALFDRCANPLSRTFADVGNPREKLIRGEGYSAAMKSEQQLLLQYLKTKELRLQIEAELRRPL